MTRPPQLTFRVKKRVVCIESHFPFFVYGQHYTVTAVTITSEGEPYLTIADCGPGWSPLRFAHIQKRKGMSLAYHAHLMDKST